MENKIISIYETIKKEKFFIIGMLLLAIVFYFIYFYISNNDDNYHKVIAKITSIKETKKLSNNEEIYNQDILAIIKNGEYKDKMVDLKNTASYSQIIDNRYQIGNKLFVTLSNNYDGVTNIAASILDVKRDNYIIGISLLFIFIIILIGRLRGLRSLISLIVNIIIFLIAVNLYLDGYNLFVIMAIASLLFIILSIIIVYGFNKKALSAMIGTTISVIASFLISLIAITLTNSNGIHYEEMEFAINSVKQIFLVEILIGTVGAIVDIGVSISSSIEEIYEVDKNASQDKIKASSREIANDIMSTMTNTLLFAYISGSIPSILLWLKNGVSISSIISVNLSLELTRALTGSIGIVISVPICIFIANHFLKKESEE
jgi:uncharacterized membrane protein